MKRIIKKLFVTLLITVFISTSFDFIGADEVSAASKVKLSDKSIFIENGKSHKISLKGVSTKKAKKIKWSSSNIKVASVKGYKGNKAIIKTKKPGNVIITATYKGRKYKCRVKVIKKNVPDNPKLNASNVVIHRISDYAIPYIGENSKRITKFQFKVTGTRYSVLKWSIEGDAMAKKRFIISNNGVVWMLFGSSYDNPYSKCTVKAELSSGKVLIATVTGCDDDSLYVQKVINNFKEKYITYSMTEYEKMEKVAWYLSAEYDYELYQPDWTRYIITGKGDCMASRVAVMYFCRELGLRAAYCPDYDAHGDTVVKADGKVYLVTTGFNEKKPRTYWINEMTRELFDKRNEKNHLNPEYFWGE